MAESVPERAKGKPTKKHKQRNAASGPSRIDRTKRRPGSARPAVHVTKRPQGDVGCSTEHTTASPWHFAVPVHADAHARFVAERLAWFDSGTPMWHLWTPVLETASLTPAAVHRDWRYARIAHALHAILGDHDDDGCGN
jgi:hypothetical protein